MRHPKWVLFTNHLYSAPTALQGLQVSEGAVLSECITNGNTVKTHCVEWPIGEGAMRCVCVPALQPEGI